MSSLLQSVSSSSEYLIKKIYICLEFDSVLVECLYYDWNKVNFSQEGKEATYISNLYPTDAVKSSFCLVEHYVLHYVSIKVISTITQNPEIISVNYQPYIHHQL